MEIEVPNPGFRLKPGMYARVRLTAGRKANALTVPRAAVIDVGSQRGVYTLENDVVRFRPIEIGLTDLERVEVLDGVTEGTRVVTTGALAIRDGDRVTVAAGRAGGGGRGAQSGGQSGRSGDAAVSGSAAHGGGAPAVSGVGPAEAGAPTGGGRRGGDGSGRRSGQGGRSGGQ
jgi:multidrug efflux pump subunit AcrA (membrane-fusion protein)